MISATSRIRGSACHRSHRESGTWPELMLGHDRLSLDGMIEQTAKYHTIYCSGMHSKADNPSRALIHDDQGPVSPQCRQFAAKQINTPDCPSDDPRRSARTGPQESRFGLQWSPKTRRTMSLSMATPKAKPICWAIRGQPHDGLRSFMSPIALMSLWMIIWGRVFARVFVKENAVLSLF